MDNRILAVDFDGTLCTNAYPKIGGANKYLIDFLKNCQKKGDKIILWTCRSGELLFEAVEWCKKQGLSFDAVNDNLPEIKNMFDGESRKIFANWYIDDRAGCLGCVYQMLFEDKRSETI